MSFVVLTKRCIMGTHVWCFALDLHNRSKYGSEKKTILICWIHAVLSEENGALYCIQYGGFERYVSNGLYQQLNIES